MQIEDRLECKDCHFKITLTEKQEETRQLKKKDYLDCAYQIPHLE